MRGSQLQKLTKEQFELYKRAVEYGLDYKSGALDGDPQMRSLWRRFTAEEDRRFNAWWVADEERRRIERDAAAASARRDLGL